MSVWEFANPNNFMSWSKKLIPSFGFLAFFTIIIGFVWGLFFTPDDAVQGSAVKILFVHVPSAFLAINIYLMMFFASLIWLVRRHHVSVLAAKAAAPIGIVMTISAICTGALWGKPMWGTAWAWDPRLTSFALMLFFYFAYIALWNAIGSNDKAADLTSILCLVGTIFALLSRYAVFFWDQGLHQGPSLSLDKQEHMSDVFFYPLILSMMGFVLLFLTLVLIRTRTEVRKRRIETILSQNITK